MLTADSLLPGATFHTAPGKRTAPDKYVRRYDATRAVCVTASGTSYLLRLSATVYPV